MRPTAAKVCCAFLKAKGKIVLFLFLIPDFLFFIFFSCFLACFSNDESCAISPIFSFGRAPLLLSFQAIPFVIPTKRPSLWSERELPLVILRERSEWRNLFLHLVDAALRFHAATLGVATAGIIHSGCGAMKPNPALTHSQSKTYINIWNLND